MENMKKLNKVIVHNKNINIHKTPYPIRETRVSKLVFITIPCLNFWAQKIKIVSNLKKNIFSDLRLIVMFRLYR